jgi:hypothetical protein
MHGWPRALMGAACVLLAGCATVPPVDPALFPRDATPRASAPPVPITLVVPKEVARTVARSKGIGGFAQEEGLHVGRIVERAGAEALSAQPARPGSASVVVDAVDCTLSNHLKWLVPLPLPGVGFLSDASTDVRVTMSLRLIDGTGRLLIERRYDSGPYVLASQFSTKESAQSAVRRLMHEAAWQLWQQAADDIGHALVQERMRERTL